VPSFDVTCAIKPIAKCVDNDEKHYTELACTDFSTCIDAADTNHDGLIGFGDTGTCPPNLVDNGDGTITDNRTGLMWEKKDDAGGIHDKDDVYTLSTCANYPCVPDGSAFTVFLADLNTPPCFAGHCDWRLPTVSGPYAFPSRPELESIVRTRWKQFCGPGPCVSTVFNNGCTPGCTVMTCSCTEPGPYWSVSSNSPDNFVYAWSPNFASGGLMDLPSTSLALHVRAVRGGS
jgi:hypothetical protein